MLRDTLLYLSNQPRVFNYVRNSRLAKHFAKRFVPGETLADAIEVVRVLNARGISASLDLLGESVTNEREARAAANEYLAILDRIHERRSCANVSLKLSSLQNTMLNLGVSNLFSCTAQDLAYKAASEMPTGSQPNSVIKSEDRSCGFNRRHSEMINMPQIGPMAFLGVRIQR